MPLETESITGLRAMAQAMGVVINFADDKKSLLLKIKQAAASKLPTASIDSNEPMDYRLRVKPPLRACTQKEIYEALQPLFERGLILDFPNEEQWRLQKIIRHEDSGTLWMPLRSVIEAAKRLLKQSEKTAS